MYRKMFGHEVYRYKYAVLNKSGHCEAIDNDYNYLVSMLEEIATINDKGYISGERISKKKLEGLRIVELDNELREKIINDVTCNPQIKAKRLSYDT